MRASIVPRWNKSHRRTAIAILGLALVATVVGVVAGATHREAREGASGPREGGAGATDALASAPARAADAEPEFDERAHDVLWADDFEDRLRAVAPKRLGDAGRLGRYLTLGDPFVRLDPEGGINGSGAVRMDWVPRRGRAGCDDDSRVLEASFEPAREIVIQFSVRYTPGFVFDWSRHRPCTGNAKKLFLLWAQEGSRFVFISENGTLGIGSDHDHPLFAQNRGSAITSAELADGKWHRITFQVRQGSASDRADGSVRGWIDGVERWHHRGVVTHNAGGYHLFKFPATFNQGSPAAQSEWVDALRVWRPS